MRALLDALLVNGPRSGVEHAVVELARALVQLGSGEVAVACRRFLPRAEPWLAQAEVVRAPSWTVGRLGRIAAQQLWLPRLAKRYPVLHGPAYVLPWAWPGRCLLTVYDLIALLHPAWAKPANVWHYRLLLPRSVAKADVVIAPSRVVADELREHLRVEAGRVRVIPLGVRAPFLTPASAEDIAAFRGAYGLHRPFFAVAGNLEPKKNVRGVVRAFELAAPRVEEDLVIAGRLGWRYQADLAALAASPLRPRMRLLGRLTDAQLRCLYSACTALIQWSRYEGFGLVPLEAMSCGAAVIVSDGGALPEVAGPGAWVVPLAAPEALAEAMVALAGDLTRRRQLAERGRRWAQRFTWHAHAQAVLDLYRQLA
jgi:glycosyltransferase involved in cell wall biosynthesis